MSGVSARASGSVDDSNANPNPRVFQRASILKAVEDRVESLENIYASDRLEALEDQLRDLKMDYKRLEDEVRFLKGVIAQGGMMSGYQVKPPDAYEGQRDHTVLEDFLWDMGQFLDTLVGYNDEAKVRIASTFLSGNAKLWWRMRDQDLKAGRAVVKVDTWEEMQRALRDRFRHADSDYIARLKLRYIKQTGSIRDYIESYSALMLQINSFDELDRVIFFIQGFEPWAEQELMHCQNGTLAEAIIAAEQLVDLNPELEMESTKKQRGCFLCGNPDHRVRHCPERQS